MDAAEIVTTSPPAENDAPKVEPIISDDTTADERADAALDKADAILEEVAGLGSDENRHVVEEKEPSPCVILETTGAKDLESRINNAIADGYNINETHVTLSARGNTIYTAVMTRFGYAS